MKRPVAYFAGTGRGIPSTVFKNDEFAAIGIETTDEWIVERTGIKQRYFAKTESATQLAATASRSAMDRAGVLAGELDIIVLGTASPDRLLPSAAVDLQAALGASRAAAFDIGAACTGFIYSATIAESMIAAGHADTALIVGVEKLSAIMDWTDRSTCVLFGDGAGAAVLKRSTKQKGILSTFLRSDGTLGDLLCRPSGGAARPVDESVLAARAQ
jgi:3-oxoacyl-[acyl-carrier-protein] synthase-3